MIGSVKPAGMAELADALDLGSSGATRVGSSPTSRTNLNDTNVHHPLKGRGFAVSDYKYEMTEISPVEKDVKVVVPEAAIREKLDEYYESLARTADIKGFRKGKVPRKVIEKMYRKKVHQEITADLLREGYEGAVEKFGFVPLALPTVRQETYSGDGDYTFSFVVETRPEIGAVAYEGLEVEKERLEVDEKQVDYALEYRRQQMATMQTVEDRTVTEKGDWVRLDYEGFRNGEPLPDAKGENELFQLDGDSVLPGFADGLIGKTVGEPVDVSLTVPEDFRVEAMRGTEILFKCKINEIAERVVPELDDDLAKDLGDFQNLEELRQEARKDLEEAENGRIRRNFRNDLWKKIVERNPFDLPPSLLEEHTKAAMQDQIEKMQRQGLDPSAMNMPEGEMLSKAREAAEMEIRTLFLQDKLAKDLEIEVTDADLDAHLEDLAKKINMPVENLRGYYSDEKHLDGLRHALTADKLADTLEEKVTLVEIEPHRPELPKPEGDAADSEGGAEEKTEE